jgi:hypothetical protein
MKKIIIIAIAVLLLIPTTASVLACDPTATPRPTRTEIPATVIPPTHEPPTITPTDHRGVVTIIYVTPIPSATNPPRKHKTPVPPPVYKTVVPCMSDCEFKREVIDLLEQILAEVSK